MLTGHKERVKAVFIEEDPERSKVGLIPCREGWVDQALGPGPLEPLLFFFFFLIFLFIYLAVAGPTCDMWDLRS